MTEDNPAFVEQQRTESERITEEANSTISLDEEARIRAEVRTVMNQKFAAGGAKLESNPVAQNEAFVKSAAATSDVDVIDLISQSVASLKITAYDHTWFSNLGGRYPFPCWEWRERSRILAFIVWITPLASATTVLHNALEAESASMLLWA